MPDDGEFDAVIVLIGDIIDGLEAFQVPHADPFIEVHLGDLRYVRARLVKLIEKFRAS